MTVFNQSAAIIASEIWACAFGSSHLWKMQGYQQQLGGMGVLLLEGSYNPPPSLPRPYAMPCHAILKLWCGQGHIPNRHHGNWYGILSTSQILISIVVFPFCTCTWRWNTNFTNCSEARNLAATQLPSPS